MIVQIRNFEKIWLNQHSFFNPPLMLMTCILLGFASLGVAQGQPAPSTEADTENTLSGEITLTVTPETALVDVPITARLSGLTIGQQVTLSASTTDANDVLFTSHGVFMANTEGVIDTSKIAPISGTYSIVESSGLLWSMRANSGARWANLFSWHEREILIEAKIDKDKTIQKSITRIYPWANISNKSIDLDGFVGDLWLPESEQDLPLILNLGGYGSNTQLAKASLLAARGFAVLDLVYHGQKPLPQALEKIPLEYAKTAIDWASKQDGVDGTRIGVLGTSKGAEYALLLASTYPEIKAVVAVTPSSVSWAGINPRSPFTQSSWTYQGQNIPFIPAKVGLSGLWRGVQFAIGKPVAFHDSYASGLENKDNAEKAAIAVENITGPILLISGSDDQVWPAKFMGDVMIERLAKTQFSYGYRHINFEKAGHSFPWSQWPQGSGNSGRFIHGGEPEFTQKAGRRAWVETIHFFKYTLRSEDGNGRLH